MWSQFKTKIRSISVLRNRSGIDSSSDHDLELSSEQNFTNTSHRKVLITAMVLMSTIWTGCYLVIYNEFALHMQPDTFTPLCRNRYPGIDDVNVTSADSFDFSLFYRDPQTGHWAHPG